MTTAALRKRLEALEQAISTEQNVGPAHIFIVALVGNKGKELKCIAVTDSRGRRIERNEGESREDFHQRVERMSEADGKNCVLWLEQYEQGQVQA